MFATAKRQTFNGRDVLAHLAYTHTHTSSPASERGRIDMFFINEMKKKMKSNVYFIADRYRQAFYEVNLLQYPVGSVLALGHGCFLRPFFRLRKTLFYSFYLRKCEKENINKINTKTQRMNRICIHTHFYAINIAILILFYSWQINLQIVLV